jgi:hypothetical protein
MQSLPTPVTTQDLNTLLSALEQMPSAKVNRHADIITVTATRKDTGETVKVLSAATRNGQQWHVMAVPGLIAATKFTRAAA